MNEITEISIKDYLEGIGIPVRKDGNKYFASSPFSRDTNWSFCIYPTNTYFDFSSGHGGNIINLVSRLNGVDLSTAAKQLHEGIKYEKYKPNYKQYKQEQEFWEDFKVEKYTNTNPEEIKAIEAYAKSRGITEGYFPGVFFTRLSNNGRNSERAWQRVAALGFLHVDKNLKPCGAKFRRIDKQEPRFSARGKIGIYLLDTFVESGKEMVYVVEGEANANSLMSYMKKLSKKVYILSFGAVSTCLEDLPIHLRELPKKLIIDYDGNEELYNQRLELYKDLGAQPIKLILPKGEDINSLYCQNKMWLIENLLL